MGDGDIADLSALLHELAEGLHSTGNYLGAARQASRSDISWHPGIIDAIEKALVELSRSKNAFRQLRARLSDSATNAGEPAANEALPMTRTRSLGRG